MRQWWTRILVLQTCLLVLASLPALAQTSKLNPRARIALSELRSGGNPKDMIQMGAAAVTEAGELDVFIRGTVTRAELEAAGAVVRTEIPGGIFTAFIPESAVEAVAALPGVQRITGAVFCEPNLDASMPTTKANIQRGAGPAFTGANGAGVMIGDVDSGIGYKHDDFKTAGGNTRILYIWDQTDTGGPNPSGYAYGSEWLSADIDALTARETDTNGHGTNVMGVAAGDGSGTGGSTPAFTYVGMAPMADIVEVKSDLSDTHILDGIAYFFNKATALGKNAVMNLSIGSQYGPHDGSDDFEAGIGALTGPGKIVCVSAGNEGQSGIHGSTTVAPSGTTSMTFLVSGSGLNRIFAFDGYYDSNDDMTVTIVTPNSTTIGPVALGNINASYPGTATTNGRVYLENGAYLTVNNDREVYIEVRVASGNNANGTWTLRFAPGSGGIVNGRVDMWRFYTSTTALAARFVTGREDAYLVSEPGTANNVITCAAWVSKQYWTDCGGRTVSFTGGTAVGTLAGYSSNGPTRDGRDKPDIAAPGDAVGTTRSLDITQTCGTTASLLLPDGLMHNINSGTSFAAPHVSGACALLMQKFGALTPAQLKTKLAALALVDGNTGAVPNGFWGAGKLRVDVTDPQVAVTYPNGGEDLIIGDPYDLTWNASDPVWSGVASVDLELSRDNGGSWETVATGVANSGLHSWTATSPPATNALLRVTAHDLADNTAQDVSDASFMISTPQVPVGLSLFLAEATDAGVRISWKFAESLRFVTVGVERSLASAGDWIRIEATVVTDERASSVLDGSVQNGITYYYRLRAMDRAGQVTTFGPISTVAGKPITAFLLNPVWPNPAQGSATVEFAVPRESHVSVKVFDIQGRAVATLVDDAYGPGKYQTVWDGRTDGGSTAAGGIYFVSMTAPGQKLVQRVVLSR